MLSGLSEEDVLSRLTCPTLDKNSKEKKGKANMKNLSKNVQSRIGVSNVVCEFKRTNQGLSSFKCPDLCSAILKTNV